MKKRFTILIAAIAAILIMGLPVKVVGQNTPTTLYSETFGDNGNSNTAYASYSGYSATTAMFTGSGTVASHYTGSGKVGKNNVSVSDYDGASGNSAAWYTASTGNNTTEALVISGINISGYESLTLSFGMIKTSGTGNNKTNNTAVTYKIDNGDYQTFSFTNPTDNSWHLESGSLSGTGSSLTIKFTMTTNGGYTTRYDDIKVTGVSSGGGSTTPTISVTPTSLSGFTYEAGSGPSTTKTISVSGSNLTANISLSLGDNSNFEMSTTEGSVYTNSLTLTQSNGSVAATTVYVRLKAGLSVGNNYIGTINLTSTGATAGSVSLSGSVTQPEAPNVTWDLTIASYDEITDTDIVTWSSNKVTMTNSSKSGGTSASNYLGGDANNRTSTRFYASNTLTITPTIGHNISRVVFTATTTDYASTFNGSTWEHASSSVSSTVVTVTPAQGYESGAISATIGGTCGFTEVKVYYTVNETPIRTITFNGNGGTFGDKTTYSQQVYNNIATALTPNKFTNSTPNTAFAGWSNTADGTVVYADGASVTLTADLTLYAKWSQSHIATVATGIEYGSVGIVGGSGSPITLIVAEGVEVTLTNTPDEGYEFSAWNVYKDGDSDTKVTVNDNKFTMPGYDVKVSATFTPYVAATYSLATSIESGRHYIITNANFKAMGAQNMSGQTQGNNRSAANVNIVNGVATVSNNNVYEFVINAVDIKTIDNAKKIVYSIYDAQFPGFLYAASSGNNYLKTQTINDDNGLWTIEIEDDDTQGTYGVATIIAQGSNTKNNLKYNSGSTIFSCYSSGQGDIYLYVKDEDTPQYDFYKDITGFGNGNVNDKWSFISLPVSSACTLSDSDLVDGTYDLYRLNNTTWENYKNNDHEDFTALNNGQGYLYANSVNKTLHFSGAINAFTTTENANQKNLNDGWNLIGNPYSIPIYINREYYKMNAAGTAVEAVTDYWSNTIPACTGVVVRATGENEKVTFSTSAPAHSTGNHGNLQLTLSHNVATRDGASVNSTIDNAIVSFNEGSQLEKFYFGEQAANIFIPQNGDEYAIAFSDRQGEMPLNFKANEVGTYTINFETNGRSSLQGAFLIDVLEEEEIDLSVNPSYTFIGSPADRAERFKIVFRNNANDIFAYQNGSDIVITGEGELQIFDVMGRIVSTHYVSGVETINFNAHGVYILRLNGMTQKIVVK